MNELNNKCKNIFLYDHLCKKRNSAAKIFPFYWKAADGYIGRIQGVKLTPSAIRALKRG